MSIRNKLKSLALCTTLALAAAPAFAYSVSNGQVLDAQGNPIQLRGVNWFGFDTGNHTVHGLWARNWKDMISQMQSIGVNAVRLPFCPASLQASGVSSINYGLNPDLQNLNSQQLMDKVIKELTDRGMYVLLDHHSPDCSSISELWYTSSYSEDQWINDLKTVAQRYSNNPYVIGIDLKNEPHGAATWGTGNSTTDWNSAAERAAAAVLSIAPKWLVGVEGISADGNCTGGSNHFWGENLEPIQCKPLNIPSSQLLLIPHTYGPDVYMQPYMSDANFPNNLPAIWEKHFGFVTGLGYTFMLGEFGGKYGQGNPKDVQWQNALVNYLISKGIHSGFYWSWNPNSGDTGGILNNDWTTLRDDKVNLLKTLWKVDTKSSSSSANSTTSNPGSSTSSSTSSSSSSAPPTSAPSSSSGSTTKSSSSSTGSSTSSGTASSSGSANTGAASVSGTFSINVIKDSDWNTGYCERVQVTNTGASAAPWVFTKDLNGTISSLWSAAWTQKGNTLTVTGFDWNRTLAPGAKTEFGYCVNKSAGSTTSTQPVTTPAATSTATTAPSSSAAPVTSTTNTAATSSSPTASQQPVTTPVAATPAPVAAAPVATPTVTTTPKAATVAPAPAASSATGIATKLTKDSDWGSGYCARVQVTNKGSSAATWNVTTPIEGKISSLWSAQWSQQGSNLNASGLAWNQSLAPGASTEFGFCATR